jgi:hypothetical protein
MLTRIIRKVPYFKGEVDAFQLNSKNAMYRPSCVGLLGQTPSRLQSRSIDRIASTVKHRPIGPAPGEYRQRWTRVEVRIGADLDESGVDLDKESQHENYREDHTFGGFGCTDGSPCRRTAARAERIATC